MSDKALPDWVKVDKKRFNVIKNKIQQAKYKNLQTRPNCGSPIYFYKSYKLIQDIEHSNINHKEALKIMTDIGKNIERLDDLNEFNLNQVKVLNALFMVDKIFTGETKVFRENNKGEFYLFESKSNDSDNKKESNKERQKFAEQLNEEPGTTDMPSLESEEYAAHRRNQHREGLKIPTPNQMLSRLPIALSQLKAENTSEKLKNQIRQILYSLYRSKKPTKQIYKSLIDII